MLVRRPVTTFDLSSAAFDRTFQQLVAGLTTPSARRAGPVVRSSTADGVLTLTVDLPGVPAEAVGVEVADRTLSLNVEHDGLSWRRSTRLGAQYDLDSVRATYVDGRLTVTVGAAPAAEPRKIAVSTSAPVVAVEAGETPAAGETVEAGTTPAEVPAGETPEG